MVDLFRVLRNFASVGMMRLVSSALAFLFIPYLGRARGEETLGMFSTVMALYLFFENLPLLGLHLFLIKEVASGATNITKLASNACVLAVCLAAVMGTALGLFGQWKYDPQMHVAIWLVGASLIPTGLIAVVESVFIGKEELPKLAGLNVLESLVRIGLWFSCVRLGFDLPALFASFLLGRILLAAGYYRFGNVSSFLDFRTVDLKEIVRLVRVCPTFLGIRFLASSVNRLDFLMLERMAGARDVGLYSAPYKLYELTLMVPSLCTVVLYPLFSRTLADSKAKFEELTRQVAKIYFVGGMPFAIWISFRSGLLMQAVFGPRFEGGEVVLSMLVFGTILAALDQTCVMAMLARERQDLDLRALILSSATYAVLLAVFIPPFGYIGAGLATLLTAIVQTILKMEFVRRELGLAGMARGLIKPAFSSLALAGFLYLTRGLAWYAELPLAFTFYGLTLWITESVTKRDFLLFKDALDARKEPAPG